jgi:hypothetical protein
MTPQAPTPNDLTPTQPGWYWVRASADDWVAVWVEDTAPGGGGLHVCVPSTTRPIDRWWRPVNEVHFAWGPRIPNPESSFQNPQS